MSFGDVSERAKCKFLGLVTRHTIERLLDIKSIYEVTSLQIEKLRENWKAVEESLYINYAIRDAGVIAVLGTVGVEGLHGDDFLITDEPASPETLVEGIGRFPLEPATCAYAVDRERIIKEWAERDKQQLRNTPYEVGVEQEPGSGGKESAESTIRNLIGFRCFADRVTGSKGT
jgi:hypothetical protein